MMLYDVNIENMGLVKSFKESSYLFGLIWHEVIMEFYPVEEKGGKNGRTKK